jgi:hypothetical protein
MATYTITLTVNEKLPASVEKKLRQAFGRDIPIHTIEKSNTAKSRSARLSEAESDFENAKSVVTELKDEMEGWHDSIPENLQSGTKADEVQEAIDALEQIESEMENVDFSSVNFPSMF